MSINDKKQESGASLVEYALLVALIAVIAMPAVGRVGNNVCRKFQTTTQQINAAVPCSCPG